MPCCASVSYTSAPWNRERIAVSSGRLIHGARVLARLPRKEMLLAKAHWSGESNDGSVPASIPPLKTENPVTMRSMSWFAGTNILLFYPRSVLIKTLLCCASLSFAQLCLDKLSYASLRYAPIGHALLCHSHRSGMSLKPKFVSGSKRMSLTKQRDSETAWLPS